MQRVIRKVSKFLANVEPLAIKEKDKVLSADGRRGIIESVRKDDEGELIFGFEWSDGEVSLDVNQHRCTKVEYRGKHWKVAE
jgi:hypothetical protein